MCVNISDAKKSCLSEVPEESDHQNTKLVDMQLWNLAASLQETMVVQHNGYHLFSYLFCSRTSMYHDPVGENTVFVKQQSIG